VGYLSLFPLLGRSWEARYRINPLRMRRRLAIVAAVPVVAAAFMVAEYRTGMLQRVGLTPKADPTVDMYGWDQVAAELRQRGMLDDPSTFLFTRNWFSSGQLAFATRGSGMPVVCYNHKDARSFAFWSRPEDWVGRDGILVSFHEIWYEPGIYYRYFERVEPAGTFEIARPGGTIRKVRLFRCTRQTVAFPFLPGDPDPARSRVASDEVEDAPLLR
jgi:hypothetical protein